MEITVFEVLASTLTYSVFIAVITVVFVAQYQSTGIFNVAFPGYALFGGVLVGAMTRRFLMYSY